MAAEATLAREVIVYATPLCPPCDRLQAYLRARGVAFTATDLMMDEAAARYLEEKNIRTTPVLEVDGEILAGPELKSERIDALLGL